jgi:hypothetical protein
MAGRPSGETMRAAALAFLLLCLSAGPSLAAKSCVRHEWVEAAKLTVDFSDVNKTVEIGDTQNAFDALAFEVAGNAMVIRDVHVAARGGEGFFFPRDMIFADKTWRRDLAMPDARGVERVTFAYRRLGGDKEATVTIWGRWSTVVTGRGC